MQCWTRELLLTAACLMPNAERPVTVFVLHSSTMSGPAKDFLSRLILATDPPKRHVFAPAIGSATDLYANETVLHITPYSSLSFPRTLGAAVKQCRSFIRDIFFFGRSFRTLKADCVIVGTTTVPAAYIASRLLGIPTLIHCGELYDKGSVSGRGRSLSGLLLRSLVPRVADVVVCCSQLVLQQFSPCHRAKVVALYSPIEVNKPLDSDAELRARLELPSTGTVVTVIGTIARGRGQDVAIKALEKLVPHHPDLILALAGEPGANQGDRMYLDALHELVEDLRLADHVRFLGHVSVVEELITVSQVVVNPARFNEPFGRVAYEALAVGRPVVVTATGALTELLKDQHTALIVPPDDPKALADAVHDILMDRDLAQTLVRNAKPVVEALNQADNDRRFLEIFATLN
jgi:glycosyltransferase involved in cell wall biosynthesis